MHTDKAPNFNLFPTPLAHYQNPTPYNFSFYNRRSNKNNLRNACNFIKMPLIYIT